MSAKELRQYSFLRAIGEFGNDPPCHNGLAYECSQTISRVIKRIPSTPYSFFVPWDVLTRDLTVGTASQAGYLVSSSHPSFIEYLRAASVVLPAATFLPGLRDNASVPRQSNTGAATWLASEGATITQSEATFQEVALVPKNVGCFSRISRQLTLQANPGIEALVLRDQAEQIGGAVDFGTIQGSGASGQPTGIINTAGIGTLTGASFDFGDAIEAQTDLNGANALRTSAAYVTTPAVAALLQARPRITSGSVPLWEGSAREGVMVGHRAVSTTQMPAATLLFGELSEVIIGEWGILEIMTDPFSAFTSAKIGVRAVWSIDVAVRHAPSFTVATSVS